MDEQYLTDLESLLTALQRLLSGVEIDAQQLHRIELKIKGIATVHLGYNGEILDQYQATLSRINHQPLLYHAPH